MTITPLIYQLKRVLCVSIAVLLILCDQASSSVISAPTTSDYLLVGRGSSSVAVSVKVSSSESLGEIKTVPSPSNPDVDDNPPWPLPAGATPPVTGVSNDGNIAVTHSNGNYDFADIDITADIGIRCVNGVTNGCQESFSNSTLTNGTFANDPLGMAAIEAELDAAHTTISGLSPTTGWSLSGQGNKQVDGTWKLNSDGVDGNTTISLAPGENVIFIDTGSDDMKINNAGLVIDGPAGSSVVFILENQSNNFLFSNASITHGQSGIDSNSIIFAMLNGGNDTNFDFSKVIVNGAAFWDLSKDNGIVGLDNVQGCGQWVGDHLNMNDVQLARCAYNAEEIPEPGTLLLTFLSTITFALIGRRE